eukprot:CAMPEP_0196763488 /NCGR_PEP_ID=MMETSP1095-20130614/4193_1 /TAXON_ID=96789 ORGANISM="Chromulina nebulosa, Strain UTEXLB2642" /NCGR_SAMPLE_ID=MMETSP1095 /ASSEMBLY_ACC=CAM_ASM_000446 /LENGTH=322 /DNA_ID=CAMNT_0042116825 /DNA_START=74 /DNA_END=1042 /DNA_ORIENTATION=-
MSSTVLSVKSKDVREDEMVLRLSYKHPLKLPFFVDPRRMNRRQLLNELIGSKYSSDDLNILSKEVLVAMVYQLLIEKGKAQPLNPFDLDDEQPEKWYILAEIIHKFLCSSVPDPSVREKYMKKANESLRSYDIQKLINVANSFRLKESNCIEDEGELTEYFRQFSACLAVEPHFEFMPENKTGNFGLMRSSVTIAGNYNGYTGLPEHLTVESARRQEIKQRRLREKRPLTLNVGSAMTGVVLNEDINLNEDIGLDRHVRVRVEGIVSKDDFSEECEIVVCPTNIQQFGPYATFNITLKQYEDAKQSNSLVSEAEKVAILDEK